MSLRRREPIIAPGGIGRLIQVIALIVITYYLHGFLSDIIKPPMRAAFIAIGLVDR
jgi:hypothetical protein